MPRTSENPVDRAVGWIDSALSDYKPGEAMGARTVAGLKEAWAIIKKDIDRRTDDHR